jgi:hypothetical protein
MNRAVLVRIGVVAAVVLLVAAAGVWFAFLDAPTAAETELDATTPDPNVSTAPPEFTMTVTAESRSLEDGSPEANWAAGVEYDADAQARLGWLESSGVENVSITSYQRYSANRTHNYITYHHTDREAFRNRLGSIRTDLEAETETLRADNATQTYWYYREGDRSEFDVVADVVPPLGFVQMIPFEADGSTTYRGQAVERYVPVEGWVETTGSVADDGPDMYLSNTTGVLYVSEESGNIVHVDVAFTSKRTEMRAGTWFGDPGSRNHLRLSVREEVDDGPLRPDWTTEPPFDEEEG